MGDQSRIMLRRLLPGFIIVLAIVMLAWVIFLRHSGKKNDMQGTAKTAQPAATQRAPSSQPASTSQSAPLTNPSKLAATGPEDATAVFIGASTLGAAAHYVYRRRLVK